MRLCPHEQHVRVNATCNPQPAVTVPLEHRALGPLWGWLAQSSALQVQQVLAMQQAGWHSCVQRGTVSVVQQRVLHPSRCLLWLIRPQQQPRLQIVVYGRQRFNCCTVRPLPAAARCSSTACCRQSLPSIAELSHCLSGALRLFSKSPAGVQCRVVQCVQHNAA